MLVNRKNELGIRLSEESFIREGMLKGQTDHLNSKRQHLTDEQYEFGITNAKTLLFDNENLPNTNYLIKETAEKMAGKIPLNEKFDIKFLRSVPDKKATFLMGKNLTIRYYKVGKMIHCLGLFITETDDGDMLNSLFFRMDLDEGYIYYPIKATNSDTKFRIHEIPYDTIGANGIVILEALIKLLLFIELSDIIIELLEPNRKTGTRKSGKVFNQSNSNIVVVDSKWNTISVRTEGFQVLGHWRAQPCGIGRRERRIIWIDSYEKKGYVRGRSKSNIEIK